MKKAFLKNRILNLVNENCKGEDMRPQLNIKIGPCWKMDSIAHIDYELTYQDVKATSDTPMFCRFDEAFGGLCPFPDMKYLEIQDD